MEGYNPPRATNQPCSSSLVFQSLCNELSMEWVPMCHCPDARKPGPSCLLQEQLPGLFPAPRALPTAGYLGKDERSKAGKFAPLRWLLYSACMCAGISSN